MTEPESIVIGKSSIPSLTITVMLTDTFPAPYQRGVVQLWMIKIWAALWTALIGLNAVRQYKDEGKSIC